MYQRISKILNIYTGGNYDSSELNYMMLLEYPLQVSIYNLDVSQNANNYLVNYEIDNIDALEDLIKQIDAEQYNSKLVIENNYSKLTLNGKHVERIGNVD